jgi:hypothetical protein
LIHGACANDILRHNPGTYSNLLSFSTSYVSAATLHRRATSLGILE